MKKFFTKVKSKVKDLIKKIQKSPLGAAVLNIVAQQGRAYCTAAVGNLTSSTKFQALAKTIEGGLKDVPGTCDKACAIAGDKATKVAAEIGAPAAAQLVGAQVIATCEPICEANLGALAKNVTAALNGKSLAEALNGVCAKINFNTKAALILAAVNQDSWDLNEEDYAL